jgi:hypothetical protein
MGMGMLWQADKLNNSEELSSDNRLFELLDEQGQESTIPFESDITITYLFLKGIFLFI